MLLADQRHHVVQGLLERAVVNTTVADEAGEAFAALGVVIRVQQWDRWCRPIGVNTQQGPQKIMARLRHVAQQLCRPVRHSWRSEARSHFFPESVSARKATIRGDDAKPPVGSSSCQAYHGQVAGVLDEVGLDSTADGWTRASQRKRVARPGDRAVLNAVGMPLGSLCGFMAGNAANSSAPWRDRPSVRFPPAGSPGNSQVGRRGDRPPRDCRWTPRIICRAPE